MNNQLKIIYYDILNGIRMQYLKSNIPFNIVNDNEIKLTYGEIKLKYLDDKNYFIKVDKPQVKPQVKPTDKTEREFTPEETKLYLARKELYKKEKEAKINNKLRTFTPEETLAYHARRAQYAKEKSDMLNSSDKKNGGTSNKIYIYY